MILLIPTNATQGQLTAIWVELKHFDTLSEIKYRTTTVLMDKIILITKMLLEGLHLKQNAQHKETHKLQS